MADRMSPSGGQSVDDQGNVTYDFQGHIKADGLDLDASEGIVSNAERMRWLRRSDGAAVVQLNGARRGGTGAQFDLDVLAPGGGKARLWAQANDSGATVPSQVRAAAEGGPGATGFYEEVVVINGRRESDFLQLAAGAANRKVAFGTATLSFSASTDSGVSTVTHGLGAPPVVVLAISKSAPNFNAIPKCNWGSPTTTTFLLNGQIATAQTINVDVTWLAIG